MLHPKIAMIDCEDCKKFAYRFEPGENQGERLLSGSQPIPVRAPPCQDDETFCPKVKPGHSDLTEVTKDIFIHWRLCNSLDDHTDDVHYRRYRRILDDLQGSIEQSREEARAAEMQELLRRAGRR